MTQLQRQAETWPAISRILAGAICLAPGSPLLTQPVCSLTDADGDVAFTDTPPLSGDSTIEEHSVQALKPAKPNQTTLAPASLADAKESTFCDTRIVSPAENGAQLDASAASTVYGLRPSVNS